MRRELADSVADKVLTRRQNLAGAPPMRFVCWLIFCKWDPTRSCDSRNVSLSLWWCGVTLYSRFNSSGYLLKEKKGKRGKEEMKNGSKSIVCNVRDYSFYRSQSLSNAINEMDVCQYVSINILFKILQYSRNV